MLRVTWALASVSRRTPINPLPVASTSDTLTTLGISMGVGIAAFVGLSFVKAITAPLGRALRGETTIGAGLITIAVLVSTVVLAVRWSSSRSRSTLVATIGTGIFAILMIFIPGHLLIDIHSLISVAVPETPPQKFSGRIGR